ncbi:two-component sensor histidine kinase [Chitinophagaceae bacterium IBVUCB2]|nr:two-component sensor histidine kinase [Chitinophagaceae bacterium IBVUCB2]
MKLLNYTSAYFAGILLVIISIWAVVFYFVMLDEIYDSIDDGLDNQKGLVIEKSTIDSTVLFKNNFDESDYSIREIPAALAINSQDEYIDTMMYMQNEKSEEPVRLLKTVFLQNGKYYRLLVATSMVEEDDLTAQLFYSILWLYIGLVSTIIIFNNFLLKRVWSPFNHLLKQLKKFRLEKPQPITITKTNIDEFRLLNETIQKLLQQNIDTYTSQKQFIENASHELQTPLAISINKLEALAETGDLQEKQLKLVADALDNLERLTRLNKSLLLLSKIENKQFSDVKRVNINQLVKKVVADFEDQSVYNNISITIDEKDNCLQHMNEDLAVIMIINLVKNAIQHNLPGGMIHITITNHSLSVENSGKGTALDTEKIFNRFHSEEPSQVSTGLGLAIVKAITVLYNFKSSYHFNQKHIISIHF